MDLNNDEREGRNERMEEENVYQGRQQKEREDKDSDSQNLMERLQHEGQ